MFLIIFIASVVVGFMVNQQCYGLAAFVFTNVALAFLAGIYEKTKTGEPT